MKVFLDANIIIDVIQNRTEFVELSSKVLQLGLDGELELCASDVTFTTVSYYARKNRTKEELYDVLQSLRDFIDIWTVWVGKDDETRQSGGFMCGYDL